MSRLGKVFAAALIALLALPAVAQRTELVREGEDADGASAWRGSALTWGHVVTMVSLDKSADLTWNPYAAHALTLAPRYHFAEGFSAGASFTVEQELTDSDWTTTKHEPVASDLFVDLGWTGLTESTTGIRLSAAVRTALPLSKLSQAQTQTFAVAPTLRLSRGFDVFEGLELSFSTRWNQRFHEQTTARAASSGIVGCSAQRCDGLTNTGLLNAYGDLLAGPSLHLAATDALGLHADFRWSQSFLYDNAEVRDAFGNLVQDESDFAGRYATYFALGASYEIARELTLAAAVATPAPQLAPDGARRSPFFNRYTQASLDLQLNLDALASRL